MDTFNPFDRGLQIFTVSIYARKPLWEDRFRCPNCGAKAKQWQLCDECGRRNRVVARYKRGNSNG